MTAPARRRAGAHALAVAVLAASLAGAALAHGQGAPAPGGTVPSTLALSLSEPSPFRRAGRSNVFISVIHAGVTATDVPTALSLAEGESEQPLRRWSEPVNLAPAKIRLRQEAPSARALRNHHKLLLVTLTAGGP